MSDDADDLVTLIEKGLATRDREGEHTCTKCGHGGHTAATHDLTPKQRKARGHR